MKASRLSITDKESLYSSGVDFIKQDAEFDFIAEQANAWSEVVSMMLDNPTNAVLNGSVNGPGSSIEFTHGLRKELPGLLRRYGVKTMVDAPCGDMTWLQHTDLSMLEQYFGFDVEPRIIQSNKDTYRADERFYFICSNLLTRKRFPHADLILCRDFLAHLTNEYIEHMVEAFRASGSTYLLASNYPGTENEFTYKPHDYTWLGYIERPHDLTLEPFGLEQVDAIVETPTGSGVISRPHELGLFRLNK